MRLRSFDGIGTESSVAGDVMPVPGATEAGTCGPNGSKAVGSDVVSPDGPTSCYDSNSGSRGSVAGLTGSPKPCAGWVSPEDVCVCVCVWGGGGGGVNSMLGGCACPSHHYQLRLDGGGKGKGRGGGGAVSAARGGHGQVHAPAWRAIGPSFGPCCNRAAPMTVSPVSAVHGIVSAVHGVVPATYMRPRGV